MSDLAGFPFQQLNQRYLAQPSNDAGDFYGVSIVRARSITAYRCIGTYHLTPTENGGRQNIFVEVLDEHGKRDRSPMLNWTVSLDYPMQSKPLDKPDNEPAADIPMSPHDTVTVRINDGKPGGDSDSVGNLHTRHMRHGTGDTWGHNSFYVVFQRQSAIMPELPPIEPPTPVKPEPLTLEQRVEQFVANIESLAQRVAELERRLNEAEGG
jgi:hypothetical protein